MRLEPKPAPSLAVTILFPLAAIAATLALTSLLVLAAGLAWTGITTRRPH